MRPGAPISAVAAVSGSACLPGTAPLPAVGPVPAPATCGQDRLPHDGDQGHLVVRSPLPGPAGQRLHVGAPGHCRHCRHEEDIARPLPPAADVPRALHAAAVAGKGRHAAERRRLAIADAAGPGHPRDRRCRDGRPDAGDRDRDPTAPGMGGLAGNRLPDLPVTGGDGPAWPGARRQSPGPGEDLPARCPPAGRMFPCHRHVTGIIEEAPARLRGRHLGKGNAESSRHPGTCPVGFCQPEAGPGKVPGPAGTLHRDRKALHMQRLQQCPVMAPDSPGDYPAGFPASEPFGNGPTAVPATREPSVFSIRTDVGSVPAGAGAGHQVGHVSCSCPRDDPHPTRASIRDPGDRREGGKAMLHHRSVFVIRADPGPTGLAGPMPCFAAPGQSGHGAGDGDPDRIRERSRGHGNRGVFHGKSRARQCTTAFPSCSPMPVMRVVSFLPTNRSRFCKTRKPRNVWRFRSCSLSRSAGQLRINIAVCSNLVEYCKFRWPDLAAFSHRKMHYEIFLVQPVFLWTW